MGAAGKGNILLQVAWVEPVQFRWGKLAMPGNIRQVERTVDLENTERFLKTAV